jgi:hypothetical protein
MTLARDPPVTMGRFSLFIGEPGLVDFSISIGIKSLPPEMLWPDMQTIFFKNSRSNVRTVRWMKDSTSSDYRTRPFFLYLAYHSPHVSLLKPPRQKQLVPFFGPSLHGLNISAPDACSKSSLRVSDSR